MKRFRGYEFALGYLVATALWVMVAIIYPEYSASEQQTGQNTTPISTQEIEAETNRRIANYNEALAWLTVFLVLANIALWWATWRGSIRQSGDMEASIAVAKRAAENAEKALRSLEIPHVYPVDMAFNIREDVFGAPEDAAITIGLKNFGRSPAFLKDAWIMAIVAQIGSGQAQYRSERIPVLTDDVIGDKETFGPVDIQVQELVQYAHRIRDGALRLNLLVHHQLDDAMDNSFGRSTSYVWIPSRRKFIIGVNRVVQR